MSEPEVTSELMCHMRHVRAAKLCGKGSRRWCAANGIDWSAFLANGIPAKTLRDTGDPIVARVVREAEKEANG